MKLDERSPCEPVSQFRLYACVAVTVPLFMALMVGFVTVAVIYIVRTQAQVVHVAADGAGAWRRLGDLPGIPIGIGPVPLLPLWFGVVAAASLSGAALLTMRSFLSLKYSLAEVMNRRYLALLGLIAAPTILGGLADVSVATLPVFAPFAISATLLLVPPICAMMILVKERLQRSIETVQFRPVKPVEMPVAANEWFERNTPSVETLGFRRLGDYRLKQRTEHFCRFFLHEDGMTICELSWLKPSLWRTIQCYACFSVTEEATYVETGTVALPKEPDDEHFILQSVPKATVAEMLYAHHRRLQQLAATRDTQQVDLTEDDLEDLVVYGQRLLYDRLMRRRLIASNPYGNATFDSNRRGPVPELAEAVPAGHP